MGLGHGASIARSGLIAKFDAANIKSYAGTGTVWTDLSGLGNNATLFNGASYSNNGITFDGINDYADIPIPLALSYSTVTISALIKWNTFNSGMFLGFTTYDIWTSSNCLGYNNGASNVVGINAATVTSLGLLGNFKYYTFVMNASGLLSNNKIYINGVAQSMSAVVGGNGNAPGLATNLRLASWNNTGFHGNVTYENIKVYNRELTSTEIKQNFESIRGRYGI